MNRVSESMTFGDTARSARSGDTSSVRSRSSAASQASSYMYAPAAPAPPLRSTTEHPMAGCFSGIQYRQQRYFEDSVHPVHPAMMCSGHKGELPSMPGYAGYIPRKISDNVHGRSFARSNAAAGVLCQPLGASASAPRLFAAAGRSALATPKSRCS
eukprot:TRINITY_DN79410_c0_g1_i1.p1 TRINITY_DN79410_c0_g1~~TRINITY_DN79410_c0_g1_i1.p1  ORF type:complete len:156 (+),score=13.30 TRINITY_DN79410_c0_g1_i1:29-496(+)